MNFMTESIRYKESPWKNVNYDDQDFKFYQIR